jgi:hypothetical protein
MHISCDCVVIEANDDEQPSDNCNLEWIVDSEVFNPHSTVLDNGLKERGTCKDEVGNLLEAVESEFSHQ